MGSVQRRIPNRLDAMAEVAAVVEAFAIFGTAQAVEAVAEHWEPQWPINVEASFDEFNLDVRISYQGDAFTIEDRRPTDSEIRESEDGLRRLAGFMLRQNADRVRTTSRDGRMVLEFHYQH